MKNEINTNQVFKQLLSIVDGTENKNEENNTEENSLFNFILKSQEDLLSEIFKD